MIDSAYFVEFGGRLTKEANAGKTGCGIFTPGTSNRVGSGHSSSNRKMKFRNEGGATFAGKIYLLTGEFTHQVNGEFNNILPGGIAFVQGTGSKQ